MSRTLMLFALGLAAAAAGLAAAFIWLLLTDPLGLARAAGRGLLSP